MNMATVLTEPTWEELLGSNNWEGLLDPLNLTLRKFILKCSNLVQATYDAFNNDTDSKFCGSCRYGKKSFFKKVMLESASDYQVNSFLYATAQLTAGEALLLHSQCRESWDREPNWMGYVAVTSDEVSKALGRREIYVAWRGTIRSYEWMIDLLAPELTSIKPLLPSNASSGWILDFNEPKVMQGWLTIYTAEDPGSAFVKTSARTQLQTKIKQLVDQYKGDKLSIVVTGHSLGASLAVLSAFDLVESGVVPTDIPVSAITFACPRVGNEPFKEKLKKFPNLRVLVIKNTIDLVPDYPKELLGYVNIGSELVVDSRKSPSLKNSHDPGDWHNMEALLHMVAGWNGNKGEFELKVKRCLALVNKSCELLKDECSVPGSWWVEKNKGMVLNEDGEWVLAALEVDDC